MDGEVVRDLRIPEAAFASGARQYTWAFERESAPTGPLGVIVPRVDKVAWVSINGVRVPTESADGTLFAEIPRSGLQAGTNRIEVIAADGLPYHWPRGLYFGPRDELRAAWQRLSDVRYLGLRIVAGLGAASAVLAFLSVAGWTRHRLLFVPAILALLFSASACLALFGSKPALVPAVSWASPVLLALSALSVLLVAGGHREVWPPRYVLAVRICAGLVALTVVAFAISPWSRGLGLGLDHWAWILAVFTGCGTALVLLLRRQDSDVALPRGQRAVGVLLAISLLASAVSQIGELGTMAYVYGQAAALISSGLGLTAWFALLSVQLFRDIEGEVQKRLGLSRIVREQQAQLKAQQEALEHEVAKRAILEERERFSRDVHDGIGGSLVSLLMQARTGQLKDADLTASLERALEDLRIMIDALDHSGASLGSAFSAFHARIAPAFSAAGVALDWRQDELGDQTLGSPGSLLQVVRILQESCTNVIKHSKAPKARVEIGWEDGGGWLALHVADDGQGGSAAGDQAGNGLKNMRLRAEKIGGELTAGPGPDGVGWVVRLRVPRAAPTQPANS